MTAVSYYDPATGLFSGASYAGSEPELNGGAGEAWLPGRFDHLSQRVDLDTGEVIGYQPPAPPDDELRTWAWDETTKRWRSTPTIAAIAAGVRAERDRRMAASDWVTLRAVRTSTPVPADWAAYLQALADVPEQAGFPHTVEWPTIPS